MSQIFITVGVVSYQMQQPNTDLWFLFQRFMYRTRVFVYKFSGAGKAADAVGLGPMHFSHEHQNTNHPKQGKKKLTKKNISKT